MKPIRLCEVRVVARPGSRTRGLLFAGTLAIPCALGRSGIGFDKREGDGRTPAGTFALGRLRYRADRRLRPVTGLPPGRIGPADGWCDDPSDRRYNRPVRLPCRASHEEMWRADGLYDLVVEIGWNMHPRRLSRGSAIFLHVARTGFAPTAGCVALRPDDLRRLLARLGPDTRIRIG